MPYAQIDYPTFDPNLHQAKPKYGLHLANLFHKEGVTYMMLMSISLMFVKPLAKTHMCMSVRNNAF